jgi:uncharacterized C2H2 Zn-finger protein
MVHICPACFAIFAHKSSLDRHIHVAHTQLRYQCPRCESNYRRKVDLSYHCAEQHSTYLCWHRPKLTYFTYVKSVIFMDNEGIILEGRNPRYLNNHARRAPTTDAGTQAANLREEGRSQQPSIATHSTETTASNAGPSAGPSTDDRKNTQYTPTPHFSNTAKKARLSTASSTVTRPSSPTPHTSRSAAMDPTPAAATASRPPRSSQPSPVSTTPNSSSDNLNVAIIPPQTIKTCGFKRPNTKKTARRPVNQAQLRSSLDTVLENVSGVQPTPANNQAASTSSAMPGIEAYETAAGAAANGPTNRKRTNPRKPGKKATPDPTIPPFVQRQTQPCGSLEELLTPRAPKVNVKPAHSVKTAGQIRREVEAERAAQIRLLEELEVSESDSDNERLDPENGEEKRDF